MSCSPDLSSAAAASANTAEDGSVASSTGSTSTSNSSLPAVVNTGNGASKHRQEREAQKIREMTMLPKDFEPSETDVVIGRGKRARTHDGNQRLRGLIEFMIPEYSAAGSNKDEKSYIIKEIVTQIRKSSPDGGFVKFDKAKDRWFEVGDFLAREKISQTFRDAMGDSYSSSNPYKRKRRSFEKKHNAIMDIIKRRRGSSPTSVLQSGASSSPPSPASPEAAAATTATAEGLMHHHHQQKRPSVVLSATGAAAPTPPISPPQAAAGATNPALLDNMAMLNKRPGQIGFARRSMLHFGLGNPMFNPAAAAAAPQAHLPGGMPMPPLQAAATAPPQHVSLAALRMRHSVTAGAPLQRPIPHLAGSSMAAAAAAGIPRRSSLPTTLPPLNPALLSADFLKRHQAATAAALLRRPSTGAPI